MFGVPFQYTLSHVLRARLEYLQTHYQIREQDFCKCCAKLHFHIFE